MRFLFIGLFLFISVFGYSQTLFNSTFFDANTTTVQEAIKDTTDTTTWETGGLLNLNFSQVSLVNWSAGGQNSIALTGLVNAFAKYKKGKWAWENNLDLGYGIIKQGEEGFIKSDDKIDFTSKLGRKTFGSDHWFYTVLGNFKSQFSPGYNYPNDSVIISDFFAPAYGLVALGLDYKPGDRFSLFIAPFTAKFTFVTNQTLADEGAFGVDPAEYDDMGNKIADGQNIRSEIGGYIKATLNQDITEQINFKTRLELFSNYLDNPQNIDVLSESILALKVGKYITTSIIATLIYDDDIDIGIDTNDDGNIDKMGPRTQYKHVIGVGFSYKF